MRLKLEAQSQQLESEKLKMEAEKKKLKEEKEAEAQQLEAQKQQLEALLQKSEKKAEGKFVSLKQLCEEAKFSRHGNGFCPSHPRSSFDGSVTLFVFLSHRWFEPHSDPTKAHPDHPTQGSPKLRLVLEACDRLLKAMPSDFEVAIWMDWMALNQDGNPAAELGDTMQSLIGGSLHRASTLPPLPSINLAILCSFYHRRRRASCCLGLLIILELLSS